MPSTTMASAPGASATTATMALSSPSSHHDEGKSRRASGTTSTGNTPSKGSGASTAAGRSVSRTIAILTGTACHSHRLAIQSRITAAGFDILAERLEQWSSPDDDDFLSAFLGANDEHCGTWITRLTSGPIYVMVLERHRAPERWADMCGPDLGDTDNDQEVYDEDGMPVVPSGLRSQYGAAAVYAAPARLAGRQIAICFPEFASPEDAAELRRADEEATHTTHAVVGTDGGFLVREDDDIVYDEKGDAFDAHSGEPLELQHEVVLSKDSSFAESTSAQEGGGKAEAEDAQVSALTQGAPATGTGDQAGPRVFRVCPMPNSLRQPASQPRLSRAAALRMGVKLPEPPKRPASSAASSRSNDTASIGISGMPKAPMALPKSLAAPSMAPRMNKSAAARARGSMQPCDAPVASKERKPVDFSNTPGHKRSSLGASQLASLMAPAVAPRLNKAATARVSMGGNPGSSGRTCKTPSGTPSNVGIPTQPERRQSSVGSTGSAAPDGAQAAMRTSVDFFSNTPGHKRASLSSGLKSLQTPTIAPRGNRTSLSRGGTAGAEDASNAWTLPQPKASSSPAKPRASPRASGRPQSSLGLAGQGANKENGDRNAGNVLRRERQPVDYSNTPGHKRTATSHTIASLAQPTIAPRSNVATQRRLSVGAGGPGAPPRPRPSSVLGTSAAVPGNVSRPASRTGYGATPSSHGGRGGGAAATAVPTKRSTRPAAPPTSFRM